MPVFESSRKVQVSGSSLAMTLPFLFVKANEIEKGTVVNVLYGLDGVLVLSRCEGRKTTEGLMKILEKIEEKMDSEVMDLENEAC